MSLAKQFATMATIAAIQFIPNASAEETIAMLRVSSAGGERETVAEYNRYFQTQLVLLRSPAVLDVALMAVQERSPELAETWSLATLTESLQAERAEDSEIIRATLRSDDVRKSDPVVLNAIVDAYLDRLQQIELDDAEAKVQRPNGEWPTDAEMRDKAEIINRLAEEIGSSDDEMARLRVTMEQDNLRQIAHQRANLRAELSELIAKQITLQMASDETQKNQAGNAKQRALERDPLYAQEKQRLAAIQSAVKLIQASSDDPMSSPTVNLYQAELERAQQSLLQRQKELAPLLEHQLKREGLDSAKSDLASLRILQGKLDLLAKRFTAADQEYQEQLERVSNLAGFATDLAARKAEWQSIIDTRHQTAMKRAAVPPTRLRVSCIQRAITLDR